MLLQRQRFACLKRCVNGKGSDVIEVPVRKVGGRRSRAEHGRIADEKREANLLPFFHLMLFKKLLLLFILYHVVHDRREYHLHRMAHLAAGHDQCVGAGHE